MKVTPQDIVVLVRNPIVWIVSAGGIVLVAIMVFLLRGGTVDNAERRKSEFRRSSTGKSEMWEGDSEETNSTDRDLRNRLERFKKCYDENTKGLNQGLNIQILHDQECPSDPSGQKESNKYLSNCSSSPKSPTGKASWLLRDKRWVQSDSPDSPR